MILLQALKMLSIPPEELKKHYELLVKGAEDMLRVGVQLRPEHYMMMSDEEKQAFREANEAMRADMAFMIAAAIGNPEYQEGLAEQAHGEEGAKAYRKGKALGKLQNALERIGKK